MSDPSLIRQYAGHRLRLSDGLRHEQANQSPHKIDWFFHRLAGWRASKNIHYQEINQFYSYIEKHIDILNKIDNKTISNNFYQSIAHLKKEPHNLNILGYIFACIGIATKRILGYFPHPVQFMGAYTLFSGSLAQMQTGEGKTLVAGLAAIVAAASGVYVHVLSTNDYLAKRDEEALRPLFQFFQISSSSIQSGMEYEARQQAYQNAICYINASEIVFDYLKDQFSQTEAQNARLEYIKQLSQPYTPPSSFLIPALHFCIVDEADSILIDEARTPLIISRETENIIEHDILKWAIQSARHLKEHEHFIINREQRDIDLKRTALNELLPLPADVRSVWQSHAWQYLLIKQALSALYLFNIDEHYLILDGKIQIVDESTGRLTPDRSWEQGLHQLIETKEGLEITPARETLSKITFQRFFRQYFLLSGLTGTATEVARELWAVYHLRVKILPPNLPSKRKNFPIIATTTITRKWDKVVENAIYVAKKGQPVLIGTRSVDASEHLMAKLQNIIQLNHHNQIECVLLNARQDKQEADIIAQAGHPHRITIATNMAGRGTDIKLTELAKKMGGLHVILTEYHESARIDRQLIGRCGRQGDPGTVQTIVSFQDELLTVNQPFLSKIGQYLHFHSLAVIWMRMTARLAQASAQRRNYAIRMRTLKQDRELSKHIGFVGKTR